MIVFEAMVFIGAALIGAGIVLLITCAVLAITLMTDDD